jgi:hypothetical protein
MNRPVKQTSTPRTGDSGVDILLSKGARAANRGALVPLSIGLNDALPDLIRLTSNLSVDGGGLVNAIRMFQRDIEMRNIVLSDPAGFRQGDPKLITREAYNKTSNYRGVTRDQLLAQLSSFRVGDKAAYKRVDDLLDCATFAILLAFGDSLRGDGGYLQDF